MYLIVVGFWVLAVELDWFFYCGWIGILVGMIVLVLDLNYEEIVLIFLDLNFVFV